MSTTELHPFEKAGMGVGPYRFLGIVEMPNPGEDSARNFACGNPYAEVHAAGLKAGAGTCCCCGMAITVICIVADAKGDKWGVGSDCVLKTEDDRIERSARLAISKRRNIMAARRVEAKREQRRQAWLDQPCPSSRALPGETNRQFNEREQAERKAAEANRAAARAARAEQFKDVLAVLNYGGSFLVAMADALTNGPLTERQAECVARKWFPRATAANEAERNALLARLTGKGGGL